MNIIEHIKSANEDRCPQRLAMKYKKMTESSFIFLRGTCPLFYERLPNVDLFKKAPKVWVCGDLHIENFGSYKGDNRLVYFDMNDFDEAALAPCTWDLVRFLTSVLCVAATFKVNAAEAMALCENFISAYAEALIQGKSLWVERETAEGMVKLLLDDLQQRARAEFLDRRSNLKNGKRLLLADGRKALPVSAEQREKVSKFMAEFAAEQENPKFFRVLDFARRIAGTGSLGIERYSILVQGKGSPDRNYILDLKQALPSALVKHLKIEQPKWKTEAQRVVTIQCRVQAVAMAFLQPVTIGKASYILRGLQPSEDRVNFALWNRKLRRLESVMRTMGRVVAWGHLRGSGRSGSDIADELVDFGQQNKWKRKLIEVAENCGAQVERDWRAYRQAFADGMFNIEAQ